MIAVLDTNRLLRQLQKTAVLFSNEEPLNKKNKTTQNHLIKTNLP